MRITYNAVVLSHTERIACRMHAVHVLRATVAERDVENVETLILPLFCDFLVEVVGLCRQDEMGDFRLVQLVEEICRQTDVSS